MENIHLWIRKLVGSERREERIEEFIIYDAVTCENEKTGENNRVSSSVSSLILLEF